MEIEPYRQFAEMLPVPTLLVNGQGKILAVNGALARRLRIEPAALLDRRLADHVVALSAEEFHQYLRACRRSRKLVLGSLRLLDSEGELVTFQSEGGVLVPPSDDQGPLLLFRLTPRDESVGRFLALNQKIEELLREIKRRAQAEAERDTHREWLRVTLTSIGDAVIATDLRGHVLFLNPVAERMTGWSQQEAIGRPLEEVFSILNEETRRPVDHPVSEVLREGKVVGLANHTVLVSREGLERHIEDSAAPIRDDRERILGVVLVFHDVGDRRALENQLRQRAEELAESDRCKDEFLMMLAHELRNPLAPIQCAAQFLRAGTVEPSILAVSAETLDRQVQHLSRMIDDLLDVARITRGLVELRKEAIELARVVELAVEQVRPLIENRQQDLKVEVPATGLVLEADLIRMVQVLSNLLTNASKFSDAGQSIRLTAARDSSGERVVLRLQDNGIGIAPELLPHVFDPFFQADRSLDRALGGLGVGLAVARGLVVRHGGSLTVHSDGPGRGSEFVIHLPLRQDFRISEDPPLAVSPGRSAPKRVRRVLVVDDNADVLWAQSRLLKSWGHRVESAPDGVSALAVAAEFRPEVVLLDIGLPGMSGYEIAQQIRKIPGLEQVWLIAHSGYSHEEHRQKVQRSGFDHLLVKPADPDQLRQLIELDGERTSPSAKNPAPRPGPSGNGWETNGSPRSTS